MRLWSKLLVACLLLPSVAPAATWNIRNKFGTSVFAYGKLDGAGNFTAFAHEPPYGRCADHPEWDCYGGPEDYHHSVHTLTPPDQQYVLMHTGPVSNVVMRFIAPVAGFYSFTGFAQVQSLGTPAYPADGTRTFFHSSISPGTFTLAGDSVTPFVPTALSANYTLAAGDTFDIVSDKIGNYYYDDTLFTGNFTNGVPEPTQWALLLGGLGMAGAAARRRRSVIAA